jgi:hypothetical protein
MRWRYPQGTCSSIYPYHSGAQLSVSGDTSGDTLFRNPVQRFAAACRSELAPTITKERASASGCATVQAGAMCKKRTQNPPRATSWGFDPPSRHQENKELRVKWPLETGEAEIVWWLFWWLLVATVRYREQEAKETWNPVGISPECIGLFTSTHHEGAPCRDCL